MRIAILLMNRCIGSSIHSIVDSLIATNYTLVKSNLAPLFEWDTVSIDGKAIMPTNGLTIHPDYSLAEYMALDTSADELVLRAQRHIEKHSHENINFSQLSSKLSISDRQLNRRF